MNVVGIVAEYNPLHSGHAYHIGKSKVLTDADAAVCVLSSHFVQRGEPAVISKQARTHMALINGIDLVIELPTAFSCASAEYFAASAVKLLDSLGVVDTISFGSEEGSLSALVQAANLLVEEPDNFKIVLKNQLDKGCSYPVARQKALEKCLSGQAQKTITSPNNILGIEYLKALKKCNSTIKPLTISRIGQGYKGEVLESKLSSATAIRNYIQSHMRSHPDDLTFPSLIPNMPSNCLAVLQSEIEAGRGPIALERFSDIIFYRLRSCAEHDLKALPFMEDGLHNRLRRAAMEADTLDELIVRCNSSRYPTARIKRILCALLLNMTDSFLEELKNNGYAQYIRVLGFNGKGRKLLAEARKKATLPILTNPSSYKKMENPLAQRLFEHEIRAADVYVLAYEDVQKKRGGSELTTPVIIHDA